MAPTLQLLKTSMQYVPAAFHHEEKETPWNQTWSWLSNALGPEVLEEPVFVFADFSVLYKPVDWLCSRCAWNVSL